MLVIKIVLTLLLCFIVLNHEPQGAEASDFLDQYSPTGLCRLFAGNQLKPCEVHLGDVNLEEVIVEAPSERRIFVLRNSPNVINCNKEIIPGDLLIQNVTILNCKDGLHIQGSFITLSDVSIIGSLFVDENITAFDGFNGNEVVASKSIDIKNNLIIEIGSIYADSLNVTNSLIIDGDCNITQHIKAFDIQVDGNLSATNVTAERIAVSKNLHVKSGLISNYSKIKVGKDLIVDNGKVVSGAGLEVGGDIVTSGHLYILLNINELNNMCENIKYNSTKGRIEFLRIENSF